MSPLGVVFVGLSGAVATTVIAGVHLMLKGLAPRNGMLTEANDIGPGLTDRLDFAPLGDLVFGGWDVNDADLHTAALGHRVLHPAVLASVADALSALRPWPAVFDPAVTANLAGEHVVQARGHRAQVAAIEADLRAFKAQHGLERMVLVNLASTEAWRPRTAVHEQLDAFEAGLDADDPAITPLMRYLYAATRLGIAHANFTPSLGNVPALAALAEAHRVPYAGMDGKTGQTLVKTALGAMFRVRRLFVDGWYSVNFLGNNDGKVLDAPASNQTKVASKSAVLDTVVGHPVPHHQVHIHYYQPRGDAKEAWDNIDFTGFAGVPMQMKINFLCQDSILAAPLVLDLVRLLAVAQAHGEVGIQRPLSLFFKSPYHHDGEAPVHDLFEQERLLFDWVQALAAR